MKRSNTFLPLLDVISCALGAGILLAVIFSIIEVPIPAPKSDDFIAVEVWTENEDEVWGLIARHQELNLIKVIAPSELMLADLNRPTLPPEKKGAVQYASWQGVGYQEENGTRTTRSISTFLISEPLEGTWILIPYLYDVTEDATWGGMPLEFRWKTKRVSVDKECKCEADFVPGDECKVDGSELNADGYNFETGECKEDVSYIYVRI